VLYNQAGEQGCNFDDDIMQILSIAHWVIPWLVLIVGMYAIVRFVRSYLDESIFTDVDRRLMIVFSGLVDLQALIGLTYFMWTGFIIGSFPAYRIFHGITMFLAAVIPHLSPLWKDENDSTRFINNFYLLLASFLIMIVGISLIPNK